MDSDATTVLTELAEAREHCDETAVYACVDRLIAIRRDSSETTSDTRPWCCFIPCDEDAELLIVHGPAPDDYTHACPWHVYELMPEDLSECGVFPLGDAS